MKVLLVTPENRFLRAFRRGQLNNFAQLTMPYLAAFVREPHTVTLVDEYAQRVDLGAPAVLVGIPATRRTRPTSIASPTPSGRGGGGWSWAARTRPSFPGRRAPTPTPW